jgi:glucose-6-phosphate-specific signal transduction histidine kinase
MNALLFIAIAVILSALVILDMKRPGKYFGLLMLTAWGIIILAWIYGWQYLLVTIVAGVIVSSISRKRRRAVNENSECN